jgi:hypothetical protein
VKKCPECGNPSYDGAPVCGNCGYVFPKTKPGVQKRKSIFEQSSKQKPKEKPKETPKEKTKVKKPSNEPSVIDIIKEKKLIIGIILVITLIVICGIFITGPNNNGGQTIKNGNLAEYNADGFSFKYPSSWEKANLTDETHENAIFFITENNVTVEHYNITSAANSLNEINKERLSSALYKGDNVVLLDTITIDGKNASNIIFENSNGEYSRYVSILDNGKLYVLKISGNSINSTTSDSINNVINTSRIV